MSGSTVPTATWTQSLSGVRKAATFKGDSLERIALRELGDASRWTDLAALNGLTSPWIVDNLADFVAGTLLAGKEILIPATQAPDNGVADASDIYGVDLLLTNGGLSATPGGDMATVSGPDNLVQALENALAVHTDELVYHPAYGCWVYELLGKGIGETANQLAAAAVAQTISADPRVSAAQNVLATVTGDSIAVTAQAVTASGKSVPIGTNLSGG